MSRSIDRGSQAFLLPDAGLRRVYERVGAPFYPTRKRGHERGQKARGVSPESGRGLVEGVRGRGPSGRGLWKGSLEGVGPRGFTNA